MRFFLYPFALLYGLGVALRNLLYDKKILKSYSFPVPVLLVGNLSTGGTGKTPCVEYLVNILKDRYKVAILSRGYKRKTNGFQLATSQSTWKDIGDEPLQMAGRFPDVTVAVDANRHRGIQKLIRSPHPPDIIIMDDGFQHRKIKPDISILLTEYSKPFSNNHLLPVGNLREQAKNKKRADIIVVTKAPAVHSPISEKLIVKLLKPEKYQPVFFSYIRYGEITPIHSNIKTKISNPNTIIMVAGIANPSPLEQHLQTLCSNLISMTYPDHHHFSGKDYKKIFRLYHDQFSKNKIIVITEKDYSRMKSDPDFPEFSQLNLCILPIETGYHTNLRQQQYKSHILKSVERVVETKKQYLV